MPIACGALTPTEILTASRAGADLVKLFPARLGGPAYVRDVLAPLPHVRLVPTGGVGPENARSFLEAGAVAVAMGGNLVGERAVNEGRWAEIEANARACVDAVRGVSVGLPPTPVGRQERRRDPPFSGKVWESSGTLIRRSRMRQGHQATKGR